MDMSAKILVVVPAYNEEEALAVSIPELVEAQPETDVLIVDDGSTDETARVALRLARRHERIQTITLPVNSGIGIAVQSGLIYALNHRYDAVVQYDGDGQHNPAYIDELLAKAESRGFDLCVGSRFLDETCPGDNAESFRSTGPRRLGIIFFARLISLLCGVRITDPTSGFRLYGRRAVRLLSQYYPDDYPEPEAILFCARHGLNVGEAAVRMNPRQGGTSSIRNLEPIYYMIKVTLAMLIDRIRATEEVTADDC